MWLGPRWWQRAREGAKAGRDSGCGMAATDVWAGVGMRLKVELKALPGVWGTSQPISSLLSLPASQVPISLSASAGRWEVYGTCLGPQTLLYCSCWAHLQGEGVCAQRTPGTGRRLAFESTFLR